MKIRNVCGFVGVLLVLFISFLLFSPVSGISEPVPEIYEAKANHGVVNFGAQPLDNPLVLSIKVGTGGEICAVKIDLNKLSGARYYDPALGNISNVDNAVDMIRVYEIEGEEAYLFETGSRYEYNKYMTAVTHNIVRGIAVPTNKWQIELPDAGHSTDDFNLRVYAINEFSHSSSAVIPLRVVYDQKGPQVSVKANYIIESPETRPGDKVAIEAVAHDDLSGTFAVRLLDSEAKKLFGENRNLALSLQPDSDVWWVENTVGSNVVPGIYSLPVMAVDRAGNKTVEALTVRVEEKISSFCLRLEKGWNLISVPRVLENPGVGDVFAGAPVEVVETVIAGERLEPVDIQPGWGYLVKATEDAIVVVELAAYVSSDPPLTMSLGLGWNLIGYASQSLEPVMPLTFYMGADLKDEWMVLYTDTGAQARAKSTSPYVWATDSFPTITGEPCSEDSDNLPVLELGKGYWLYLTGEGVLVP